jgi:hypothetical protein
MQTLRWWNLYNYPGGFRFSLSPSFAAHLAFQAKRAIFLSEPVSLCWPG